MSRTNIFESLMCGKLFIKFLSSFSLLTGPFWIMDVQGCPHEINKLAVDSKGNSVIVWDDILNDQFVVYSTYWPNGGSASEPQLLSTTANQNANNSQVAMDEAGNAIAGWLANDTTLNKNIFTTSFLAFGGSWARSTNVSSLDETVVGQIQLVINSSGFMVAIWMSYLGPDTSTSIRAAYAQFGGEWSTPVTISQ